MTNISKDKLTSADYKLAEKELNHLISKLNHSSAKHLTEELLTPAERVMLVKRFAAVFMFSQKYSPYRVSHTISISISTAQRLFQQYQDGSFDKLLGCIQKKEAHKFLRILDDIIAAQVDPKARARLFEGRY